MGLKKRGDTAITEEVREYLEAIETMALDIARMSGATLAPSRIVGQESLVLKLGRGWTAARRPQGMRKMRDGHCYSNAYTKLHLPGLRYAEGYALNPDALLPVEHGWCVNEQDEVVDPTWRDPSRCAYWGVEIPEPLLMRSMGLTRRYGFLGTIRTTRLIQRLGRLPTVDELTKEYEGDAG